MRDPLKLIGLLLLTGILASAGPAHAGKCRANRALHCNDGQRQSIPVRIYRNFLVVAEGQLGDVQQGQNFILDTGTAPSLLNASLVRQLGLATIPSTFRATGRSIPAEAAMIPAIELGPIRAVNLPMQVQDLSRLERDLDLPIAAVIGLDVLSKSSFRLDYDKKEIEFGGVSREGIPVHFDVRSSLAVAEVTIEGKPARVLVDTGSDKIVLFGGNFPDAGWLSLRNTSQSGASPVDQKLNVLVFSAADIILAGHHFSQDRAYFVPGSTDAIFDGLLGVRALGFRAVCYDQKDGTIYLQK